MVLERHLRVGGVKRMRSAKLWMCLNGTLVTLNSPSPHLAIPPKHGHGFSVTRVPCGWRLKVRLYTALSCKYLLRG